MRSHLACLAASLLLSACSGEEPGGGPHGVGDEDGELAVAVDPSVYSYRPAVWGERVVWANEDNAGREDNVFMKDLATGVVTQITHLAKPQGPAVIAGDNIVWVDLRNVQDEDENADLYLVDLVSGSEHRVTSAAMGQYDPEIFGRVIVWRDDRDRGDTFAGDIYAYDMGPDARFGTGDDVGEIAIATGPDDQTAPDVWVSDTGRVVIVWYVGTLGGNDDVWLCDSGPDGRFDTDDDVGPVAVTTDADAQRSPTIFGRRLAWLDERNATWLDPDIFTLDLGPDGVFGTSDDGVEAQLAVDTLEPDELDLWGDRLVWDDYRTQSYDVWLYDFASGVEQRLTAAARGQFYPRIYGDLVVWQDARASTPEDPQDDVYGLRVP